MHTLLLRLAGPMQSWGTQSRFGVRDTGLEPSKSGVIGLLCAALGRPRWEPIDDLAALIMGVRVDREGVVSRDYHTIQKVIPEDGGRQSATLSERFYLADADFLVGLSGADVTLLHEVDVALRAPRWALFLGRKSFPPGVPVALPGGGVRLEKTLEEALRGEPWRPRRGQRQPEVLRVVLERPDGPEVRQDQPEPGPAFLHRRFMPRTVVTTFWKIGSDVPIAEEVTDDGIGP
ncbi:MAG: type I-E CRISPR-associated protein Cas5/CasD [Chloroflexota bacterium]